MPTALERVDADIKSSMLARNAMRLGTLRMLKSALTYYQIEGKLRTLSEQDLIAVAQKQMKQRQDAIESYRTAGRNDLAQKEEAELAILREFLPQGFSAEELEAYVKGIIAEVGATGKAQIGVVMKTALAKAAARADGKSINTVALRLLS